MNAELKLLSIIFNDRNTRVAEFKKAIAAYHKMVLLKGMFTDDEIGAVLDAVIDKYEDLLEWDEENSHYTLDGNAI